jgi:hypothetical protein
VSKLKSDPGFQSAPVAKALASELDVKPSACSGIKLPTIKSIDTGVFD